MPKKPDSSTFAKELHAYFVKRAANKTFHLPGETAIGALTDQTAFVVVSYLRVPPKLRPAALARRFGSMSQALKRAAKAAEDIGPYGMSHLLAASGADREPVEIEPEPHIFYLQWMAECAATAAASMGEFSRSMRDDQGGRTPDEALRRLVSQLHDRYLEILSMEPTHTANPAAGGLGSSPFDFYVKLALKHFAPDGVAFEPRQVDDAIRYAIRLRKDPKRRHRGPFGPPRVG